MDLIDVAQLDVENGCYHFCVCGYDDCANY